MSKKPKIRILILLISIIIIGGYFFISSSIGNQKYSNLKSLLKVEQRELIKKYIFPYKFISQLQQIISQQRQAISHQQQIISLLGLGNSPSLEYELIKKDPHVLVMHLRR